MEVATPAPAVGEVSTGTTIWQTETVSLWYHPRYKIVHHQMHKVPESATFRELLNRGAELVKEHDASKWLSDDRGNTVVRDFDSEWSINSWLPRVMRAGFNQWGIVMPGAAIGKLNMTRFAADFRKKGITVQVETTPEAAFKWLSSG